MNDNASGKMAWEAIYFCIGLILESLLRAIVIIVLFYLSLIFISLFFISRIFQLFGRLFLIPLPPKWRFILEKKITIVKNKIAKLDLVIDGGIVVIITGILIIIGFLSFHLKKIDLPDFLSWKATKAITLDIDKDKINDLIVIHLYSPKMNGKLIFVLKTNHTLFIWQKNNKIHVAIKDPNSSKWHIDDKEKIKKFYKTILK